MHSLIFTLLREVPPSAELLVLATAAQPDVLPSEFGFVNFTVKYPTDVEIRGYVHYSRASGLVNGRVRDFAKRTQHT